MIALDIALTTAHRRAAAQQTAALAAINPEGWSAQWARGTPPPLPPDGAMRIAVSRAGFDAAGAAVTHEESRSVTRRKRRPYPDHADDTPATVALDDYVYATDTMAGVANQSAEVSPRPVAAWVTPSRLLIGATIGAGTGAPVELVAFHRDFRGRRQVACVLFTITDGTRTLTRMVSATTLSTSAEDASPIEVHALPATDIAALATGTIRVDARVWPWIGTAASVLDSAATTAPRAFSTRYYHKDAARHAAPPLAYIAANGNNDTGIWSTDPTPAAARPFRDLTGATRAIQQQTAVTGGSYTGCRIRIVDAAPANGHAAAWGPRRQLAAGIVIERAPGTPRDQAVVDLSSEFRPWLVGDVTIGGKADGFVTFHDVTIARTSDVKIIGSPPEWNAGLCIQFWNVTIRDTIGGAVFQNGVHSYFFGAAFTGTAQWIALSSAGQVRMTRGVVADMNNSAPETWRTIGCALRGVSGGAASDPAQGAICYGNRFTRMDASGPGFTLAAKAAGDTITGTVVVQNLFEVTGNHPNASPALIVSGDGANGSTVHTVIAHNTIAGHAPGGGSALFHDDSAADNARSHRLMRLVGNIHCRAGARGDIYVGSVQARPYDAPLRTGHFAWLHGVGCHGEFTQFAPADAASAQLYPGTAASAATGAGARNDPLFTDDRAMPDAGGTGPGGGSYTLKPASPARGRVTVHGLGHDLASNPRPAAAGDAAGAYA